MDTSNTSKQEARAFAEKHNLGQAAEVELSQLLEKTWQDGVKCEQTMRLIESLQNNC